MGINIKQIIARDLGPIENFDHEFGLLNLVYSPNERGKTFLTEFIIHALFRKTKRWQLRSKTGKGKILVEGVGQEVTEFKPSAKERLEDHLAEVQQGLPESLAKLLVVKGAEAAITNENGGVSQHLLTEVLSGQELLERVQNGISSTVGGAAVQDGHLQINNAGEGKLYRVLQGDIKWLEELLEKVKDTYSSGPLYVLQQEKEAMTGAIKKLEDAKKHQAWKAAQARDKAIAEKEKIKGVDLGAFGNQVDTWLQNDEKLKGREKLAKTSKTKFAELDWLENARTSYDGLLQEGKPNGSSSWLLRTAIVAAIVALGLVIIDWTLPAAIGITLAAVVVLVYLVQSKKKGGGAAASEERQRIADSFFDKTGKELTDIATLETEIDNCKGSRLKWDKAKEILSTDQKEHETQKIQIQAQFRELTGKPTGEAAWVSTVAHLKTILANVETEINNQKITISRLDVDESDYLEEANGITYSKASFEDLEQQVNDIEEKIGSLNADHNALKEELARVTASSVADDWETLLSKLYAKRDEKFGEIKKVGADIFGGMAITAVIKDLKATEKEKIDRGLAADNISKPLFELTGRYNAIRLEEEELWVDDANGIDAYKLNELSTGAREQVMLAIRMGFAKKLFAGENAFFILDDAFQHTDWERRVLIVDSLVELAKGGWQVIYLTMDDHIRDLFDAKGKVLGGDYKKILLTDN